MDASYIISAAKAEQLPDLDLPEVAFMGRSNSGKSTLINTLANRKQLARASATPGRTQMINFFSLNQKLILADLPGYGFNVANREIRKLWDSLVRHYVIRPNIRYFFFLMDGRRQLEDFEYDFIIDLQEKTSVVIVLTKTDKMKTREIALKEAEIKKDLASRRIPVEGVFSISSLNKKGIDRLQKLILDLMVAEVKKDPLAEKTQ